MSSNKYPFDESVSYSSALIRPTVPRIWDAIPGIVYSRADEVMSVTPGKDDLFSSIIVEVFMSTSSAKVYSEPPAPVSIS